MYVRRLLRWALAAGLLVSSSHLTAQTAADERRAVERAVLDYVEGFYEGDTAKLVRSVHPSVNKYGYYIPQNASGYVGEPMPFAEFMSYANQVKARGQPPRADAPRRVEIYEVLDQTASAKLTAWWGIDYLLLAKENGRWMIRHVLWQTPPKSP